MLKGSVQQSFLPLLVAFTLSAFRDASYGLCTYTISVLDCLKGLQAAQRCGFLNLQNFDVESYEHYEKIGTYFDSLTFVQPPVLVRKSIV